MRTYYFSLSLLPCLILTLCLVACSDDDAPPAAAEADSPPAAEADAPAAAQETTVVEGKSPATNPWPEDISALFSTYDSQCSAEDDPSLDCEWLRGLVVADVVQALEEIQLSRDQRGAEEALAALDIVDEPEIVVAAGRVLGYFPDTPGIVDKAMPLLLESPYLAVEQAAAQLLSQTQDPAIAGMGSQWSSNHGVLYTDDPYELIPDIPGHYYAMGFPGYPDAAWYSPADSDRSVGWWVQGSPAEVSTWFAEKLGVEVMGYSQWVERSSAEMMTRYQSLMNQAGGGETQQLMEQYVQTQDPALMERIQKLQAEMETVSQKLQEDSDKALNNLLLPPGGVAPEDVYYIVAEEKDGHISRAILVYRHVGSERTVMQMAWDLRDYPPAWPAQN
jgi:hypothetical protein